MALNAAAAANPRPSIEFVVKPREDLFLRGGLRTIHRVQAGDGYPCQMQKNQNFSCLFRHYAKHNGLRKEDLVFYFVSELHPDESPESVHLMPQDEVLFKPFSLLIIHQLLFNIDAHADLGGTQEN
jgi:hypothetical protein